MNSARCTNFDSTENRHISKKKKKSYKDNCEQKFLSFILHVWCNSFTQQMYYKHISIILAAFSSSFTPSSDQLVISPYSISTLSLRKVSRIQKSISLWILFNFIPNSQGQIIKKWQTVKRIHIWILAVKGITKKPLMMF